MTGDSSVSAAEGTTLTTDELAAELCDADASWEHHDQTDDHPCSRCKRTAEYLTQILAVSAAAGPSTDTSHDTTPRAIEIVRIEGVLQAHQDEGRSYVGQSHGDMGLGKMWCSCGAVIEFDWNAEDASDAHRKHVAALLAGAATEDTHHD